MAVVSLALAILLSLINISLGVRTWWLARRDRRQPPAHPLEAVVRDIAAAIRERQKTV